MRSHVKKNIVLWVTLLVVAISSATLIGWLFDIQRLLSVLEGGATMKFNTALCFFWMGILLWFTFKQKKNFQRISLFIALIMVAFSAVVLLSYIGKLSFSIDNFFVQDHYSTMYPGRMSPATAVCFLLMGLGAFLIIQREIKVVTIGHNLFFSVSILSLVVIISDLLNISTDSKIFFFNTMSLQTAVLFFLLSIGFTLKNHRLSFSGLFLKRLAGSRVLRILLPYVIVTPFLLSLLMLFLTRKNLLSAEFGLVLYTVLFILLSIVFIALLSMRLNKSDLQNLQLKRVLENANKELGYFKHALDESSIVAITDRKGVITYVNDKFCEISKYKEEELIGQTHKIINSNYHSHEFFKDLWKTIGKGKTWVGEIKNKAKDGSYYWVLTSIIPFLDSQGSVYQYLAIRVDITKQKEAEEKMSSHYVARLEQKNKILEQFAFISSHDLRESILSVSSIVEMLELEYKNQLDEQGQLYLQYISQSAKRMKELIRDLREFVNLGKGKSKQVLETSDILSKTLEELGEKLKEVNAKVNVSELPKLEVYEVEFSILWRHLLENAIKFSKENEDLKLEIDVVEENEYWKFSIQDNGIGIEEADHEKIFLFFKRLHDLNEYEGTGIGLAQCQRIAELHGGKIWVESALGHGSTFFFTIEKKSTLEME